MQTETQKQNPSTAQSGSSPFSSDAREAKKGLTLKSVLLAGLLLSAGIVIGKQLPAGKEEVREALYRACVQGTSYKPAAPNVGEPFSCSRRSIDLAIATAYGDTYLEPIDGPTRAKYESALDKYKK